MTTSHAPSTTSMTTTEGALQLWREIVRGLRAADYVQAVPEYLKLAASQLVDMVDKIGFEPATPGVPRNARTFSFDFFRSKIDLATNHIIRNKITASVPLLTLINLPAISIQEATVDMDLQLVAHEQPTSVPGADQGPLNLWVVPAKKTVSAHLPAGVDSGLPRHYQDSCGNAAGSCARLGQDSVYAG